MPHRVALIVTWTATTAAVVAMLLLDVRSTGRYDSARLALHVAYVLALIWHLLPTGRRGIHSPPPPPPPPSPSTVVPHGRLRSWLAVAAIGLLFALSAVSADADDLVLLLLMAATVWVLVAWWRKIRWRVVVQGLGLAAAAVLGGAPAMENGLISPFAFWMLAGLVPLMYVAGGLLIDRTSLGELYLRQGRYATSLQGVFRGCLLFVPLGAINAASGSPGRDVTWVTEWWMPPTLPLFSAIAEETWFRLMLIGLCYFLLRPAFGRRPAVATIAAVLFSCTIFGLGHGRDIETFLTTGFLYGLSMAAVFVRRDWEHAVGAHYAVNMIPWLTVFLET